MKDMDSDLKFEDLQRLYARYFSLGHINGDINNKFALISLVCFLTHQARKTNPNASCYRTIMKVIEGDTFPNELIIGLAVVCEDFMAGCTEFNKCGCKSAQEMITQIKTILSSWLPF